MDKDRQIRFLYPPLSFVGFRLWALFLDPIHDINEYLPITAKGKGFDSGQVATVVAGGGVVMLVAGFLISVFSVVVLRGLFWLRGHSTYEAVWSDECRSRVSKAVGVNLVHKRHLLYLSATFDHVLLPENAHTWLLRRWRSFNIAAHSVSALILAAAARHLSGFAPGIVWYAVLVASALALLAQARFAWKHTMEMVEFYSQLPLAC